MSNDNEISRVRSLSPSALIVKRFFRNRLAVTGLVIIIVMFVFSFLGGLFSPYGESEVFKEYSVAKKEYATVTRLDSLRLAKKIPVSTAAEKALGEAINADKTEFEADNTHYTFEKRGEFVTLFAYSEIARASLLGGRVSVDGTLEAALSEAFSAAVRDGAEEFSLGKDSYKIKRVGKSYSLLAPSEVAVGAPLTLTALSDMAADYELTREIYIAAENTLQSFSNGNSLFVVEQIGSSFLIKYEEKPVFFLSPYTVRLISGKPDEAFLAAAEAAAENDEAEFSVGDRAFTLKRSGEDYSVGYEAESELISIYSAPSAAHWLGTDANGMDILTRLMYGGRISLVIGFVVVFIELLLGILLGGLAGYFGGFTDSLIMRLVDIFNCIPSLPLFIIIGAIMDAMRLPPSLRIYVLMLIMGLLGWPSVARLTRSQILSLREQEFMLAEECLGIRPMKRIFRHLIPNVIPQLIVVATMGLGSIILTESTLSFLGLGVKFPFASWGNIINSVSNIHVMTNYWFVWIPAGLLILLTVLGFNFIGDGLRDAFDPKMKR